jgi:hypothetical protein
MSDTFLPLADFLRVNGAGLADQEIRDVINEAPFLSVLFPQGASNGTVHKYLKVIGAPVVGFRAMNEGRALGGETTDTVTIDLQILDALCARDKAAADGYRRVFGDGRIEAGAEPFMARATKEHLGAALYAFERQIFQGVGADAEGFVGLPDADGLSTLADAMVLGAGGTAGQSSELTSVYAIRTTPALTDLSAVFGNEGDIKIGDMFLQVLEVTGGKMPAYCVPIDGWTGLQIGSAYSVARICNLDADDHGLTDTLLKQAWYLFPPNRKPTHFVMTSRSQSQYHDTLITDLIKAPPIPTDWHGIPFVIVSSISEAEDEVGTPT